MSAEVSLCASPDGTLIITLLEAATGNFGFG